MGGREGCLREELEEARGAPLRGPARRRRGDLGERTRKFWKVEGNVVATCWQMFLWGACRRGVSEKGICFDKKFG